MCDDLRVTMELVRGSMVPGGHQPAGWDLSPWDVYHGGHGEYRGGGVWQSGETDFGCSGGEIEKIKKMQDGYVILTTSLLDWIYMKIHLLNDRNFPNLVQEIEQEMRKLTNYRTVEKPPQYREKGNIEAQFVNLQSLLHFKGQRAYMPPEGKLIQDIDIAWTLLEKADHDREMALLEEWHKGRDRLQRLSEEFERETALFDMWLNDTTQMLQDRNFGTSASQVDDDLKKHGAIKAEIDTRKDCLHALSNMAEELYREEYDSHGKVKKREQVIMEKWRHLMDLLDKKKRDDVLVLEKELFQAQTLIHQLSKEREEEKEMLQRELGSLQAKLQSAEEKVNEKDNNIVNLNSQVTTLNTQIVELTKAKESAETRVKQLLTDGESCTSQIADLQANFSELEKQEMKSQDHGIDGPSAKNLSLRNQRRKEGRRSDEEWRRVCRSLRARARRLRDRQEQEQAQEKNAMQSLISSLRRDRERLPMELVCRETESIPAQVKVDIQDLHGELELRKAERNVQKINPDESVLHSREDFTDSAADAYFNLNSKCDDLERGMVGTSTSRALYNSTRPPEVHFIGGECIKYNSNSGVTDDHLGFTPQAFSHLTLEHSGPQLAVDMQSICDLWIDPQVHTADGGGYGDRNLGSKGTALFSHSHPCNAIYQSPKLSKFDLAEKGTSLDTQRKQSHSVAVNWYDKVCQMASIENEENKEECHGTIAPGITGEPSTTPRPPPSSWGDPVPSLYPYQQTSCPLTPEVLGLPQHSRPPNLWAEC